MLKKLIHTALLALFVSQVWAGSDATIEIKDAWIRSAPPNVTVMAGYLRLLNHGNDSVKLTDVSSRQFERIEIHRSVIRDGVAHMEKMEPLLLPGKQEVVFEPGGLHLMLINPHRPLPRGDSAHLVFKFSNDEQQIIPVKVRDSDPAGEAAMENMKHHHSH